VNSINPLKTGSIFDTSRGEKGANSFPEYDGEDVGTDTDTSIRCCGLGSEKAQ
jgi:hypothetical protein